MSQTNTASIIEQPSKTASSNLANWILLGVLALIWGSSFILVKKSLVLFDVLQVGSLRIFSAFLFFVPVFIYRFSKIPREKWGYFLLSGLLGNLFPALLFSYAGKHMDSAVSGALNSLTPLFTLLIGATVFGSIITRRQTLGIILGFMGSLFLIFVGAKNSVSLNGYAVFVVLATIMYGINLNVIKKNLGGYDPIMITTCIFMTIGPIAAMILFSGDFVEKVRNANDLMPLVYGSLLGVMGSAIAMMLFNKLIQKTSAVLASSVTYLIPIVAILWGLLDSEAILFQHYLGMSIILIGVYLVNKK